ncbi:hypothetical protein LDENG_00068660 [Lucifuga dentata]|nr:hypothetical protein LDENG_00068660 [Lucifuga dentata]
MPGTTMGKKLDLSRLTDEEAKHVWEVIQRDLDLRKKEEDRLGELKTKIEKEDTKRELLGNQTSLTESHCIRCLQAFKFLVNSKRQCLDCQLYICKSCSRYNKKEQGWVCDPCRMARVLKIGTLEWYHENVRARFKRFGSAKVMRSLFKRLNGEHISESDLRDPQEYDTQSMPEVHTDGYEEHSMDATDSQHYKGMKKTKRRLTVQPFDFDLDSDYIIDSRRHPYQPSSVDIMERRMRDSMVTEADVASVFQKILKEHQTEQEPEFSTDVGLHFSRRMSLGMASQNDNGTIAFHSLSRLSHSSYGSGSAGGPRCSSYPLDPDDSEEEDDCQRYPLYHPHQQLRSHTSQESLNSAASAPQITELNRRMSAIETILSRLEQKVTLTPDQDNQDPQAPQAPQDPDSTSPPPQWEEVDLEEQQLRQKLSKMTDNISDYSLSSDEDESKRPQAEEDANPAKPPTRPTSTASVSVPTAEERQKEQQTSHSSESHILDEESNSSFRGSTALLNELEDKVAQAAADVQNTQSQVSYIEDRIAALKSAGMPVDKSRKRSAIPIQSRRLSQNFPTKTSDVSGLMKRRLSIM